MSLECGRKPRDWFGSGRRAARAAEPRLAAGDTSSCRGPGHATSAVTAAQAQEEIRQFANSTCRPTVHNGCDLRIIFIRGSHAEFPLGSEFHPEQKSVKISRGESRGRGNGA